MEILLERWSAALGFWGPEISKISGFLDFTGPFLHFSVIFEIFQ